ncbi:MAG: hypothetical protein K1X63_02860, partial [Chitinophagales bacterium]|nr:hypothetical protein [Chitinophagales bacterium]
MGSHSTDPEDIAHAGSRQARTDLPKQLLSDTKSVNPYISGLSEDWATNSQQQLIKQGKTLHKEK